MKRIDALDVLRGVAILGTLGTNIWIFTAPGGPSEPFGLQKTVVETFLHFLTNGKFLGLLTLLFGVGLELQYRSAVRKGLRWPGRYLWRAALLFAEGVAHYVLIFEFDVLMGYALTSMIVAYLIGRSERVVRGWMIGAGAVHLLIVGLVTLLLLNAPAARPSGSTLYRDGTWPQQVVARLEGLAIYRIELIFIIPMGIVLFLAGSRLLRAGVFAPEGALLRRRLMIAGLGVAAPLNLLTSYAGPAWFAIDRYVLPPLVALGLLGLVTTIVLETRGEPGLVRRGLADVGRAALSCYVFQNVVASFVCYGWGLGLAARLDWLRPWWVPVAWAGICLLFVVLSSWWLRRFTRGPIELAWQWAYQAPFRTSVPAGK
ncbi:DUF418 domain-containing protein [Nonomuraea sp. NN258]|uniref:DUF418 domain-containing protein n=1 Tax=Nonomuraea antri TaxID=2730852 RepID=UPI0015682931|nr:DUF418 domain-containing protein [Nonomuraea antri]NRQ33405.1 DUF418 domain-containing protein [Nonomuraea antri]